MSDRPRTIDEAEAAGWERLEASCDQCRYSVHMPWRLLRMRSPLQDLESIMNRAVCERCRPKRPDRFALIRPTKGKGNGGAPGAERLPLRPEGPIEPA